MRRCRDAGCCGFHHRFIISSRRARPRAELSPLFSGLLIALQLKLQPFFSLSSSVPDRNSGLLQNGTAAKTASAPFFQGNGGWQPNKKGRHFQFLEHIKKLIFPWQVWCVYQQYNCKLLYNVSFIIYRGCHNKLRVFAVDDIIFYVWMISYQMAFPFLSFAPFFLLWLKIMKIFRCWCCYNINIKTFGSFIWNQMACPSFIFQSPSAAPSSVIMLILKHDDDFLGTPSTTK